jgi:uncharacterized protein YjcR
MHPSLRERRARSLCDQARKQYLAGKSVREIAAKMNVTPNTVYRWFRRFPDVE